MDPSDGYPGKVELLEHTQDLREFLSAWTAKQDQLLTDALATCSSPQGSEPERLGTNPEEAQQMLLDEQKTEVEGDLLPLPVLPSSSKRDSTHTSSRQSQRALQQLLDANSRGRIEKALAPINVAVILFDSVIMSVESDEAFANPANPDVVAFTRFAALGCTIYYVVEIMIKMFLHGARTFYGSLDWKWNLFDLALTVQAVLEQAAEFVIRELNTSSDVSFVRVLRLFRFCRLLRLVQLWNSLRELRLLVTSLSRCAKPFFWSSVLLLSVCYMFSLCIMQRCQAFVSNQYDEENYSKASPILLKYWSSTIKSMVTLLMSSTAGAHLDLVSDALKRVGPVAYSMFVIFIGLWHTLCMNLVSSLFVESMHNTADNDFQDRIYEMLEKKEEFTAKLQAVYALIDETGKGEITYSDFIMHESPELVAFIDSMDIDISDARHFFKILSQDGRLHVDIQHFVEGCIKMRGTARAMDLLDLTNRHKVTAAEHRVLLDTMRQQVDHIYHVMHHNTAKLPAATTTESAIKTCNASDEEVVVGRSSSPKIVDVDTLPEQELSGLDFPQVCAV